MSRYLVTFTPLEPYFFGSERTLAWPGDRSLYKQGYYIRSEKWPLQTTLFGAVRFLLLQANGRKPGDTSALSEKEQALIGPESFDPDKTAPQPFGLIRSLSPLFLARQADGRLLIPAPMDHRCGAGGRYTPFADYSGPAETADGPKIWTEEYNAKEGTVSGWLSLKDGTVLHNGSLFRPVPRTGINRGRQNDGYFKKEYQRLEEGYAFAAFCDLAGEPENPPPSVVYLGQGKSAFRVAFTPSATDWRETVRPLFESHPVLSRRALVYLPSDALVPDGGDRGVYDGLLFAAAGVRDFRTIVTVNAGDRIHRRKHPCFRHLLQAGSVLIAEIGQKAREWADRHSHPNAAQIGMNQFVILEEKAK